MHSGRLQRIEELFDAALDRPEQGRTRFVEDRTQDDPTLREEVLELLGHHREAFSYFDRLAAEIAAASSAEIAAASGCWLEVGAYRTVRELGRGGMGTVFLAESIEDPTAPAVAVKVIRRGFEDDASRLRFRQEEQILARLDHPGIARLLDAGLAEDGRPYLVMERVDGPPITEFCDDRRLSIDERVACFLEVAEAVAYAHRRGVVHCDLKPRNVIVPGDGRPRLVDFGIASLLDPEHAGCMESSGRSALTPSYAAPEQLRGERADTATDVFALGLLLYELLAGCLPWAAPTAGGSSERAPAVPPPPPSRWFAGGGEERAALRRRTPAGVLRRLAGDLDSACLRALAEMPVARQPSAEALIEELERALERC